MAHRWMIGLVVGVVAMAGAAAADDACSFMGNDYADESFSCQNGVQYRCDDGEWRSTGVTCPNPPSAARSDDDCELHGSYYAEGSSSCQNGMKYRCDDGKWHGLETACVAGDAPAPVVVQPSTKTCMMEGGSTVANASTICKSGTMFVCDNGEWRNLGTPCR